MVVLRGVGVLCNQDVLSRCLELPKDRRRILPEPHVGIEVRHALRRSVGLEDETWRKSGQGPAVFALRAGWLHSLQLLRFQLAELEEPHVR